MIGTVYAPACFKFLAVWGNKLSVICRMRHTSQPIFTHEQVCVQGSNALGRGGGLSTCGRADVELTEPRS